MENQNFFRDEWYLKWILKDGLNSKDVKSPRVGQKEGGILWGTVITKVHAKAQGQGGPRCVWGSPVALCGWKTQNNEVVAGKGSARKLTSWRVLENDIIF